MIEIIYLHCELDDLFYLFYIPFQTLISGFYIFYDPLSAFVFDRGVTSKSYNGLLHCAFARRVLLRFAAIPFLWRAFRDTPMSEVKQLFIGRYADRFKFELLL
jgi:hypothetical protein